MKVQRTTDLLDAQMLSSIIDNLPASVFVKDQDARFVISNKAHCELINKTEIELLGCNDADVWKNETAASLMANDLSIIESGKMFAAEEVLHRFDGSVSALYTMKSRLESPDGKTYLIGTNTDLNEIKIREEQHRLLAQTVPVGVYQVEHNGSIGFANKLMLEYLAMDHCPTTLGEMKNLFGEVPDGFPGNAVQFETDIFSSGVISDGAVARRVLVLSSGWKTSADNVTKTSIVSVVDLSEMAELRRLNAMVAEKTTDVLDLLRYLKLLALNAGIEAVRAGRAGAGFASLAKEMRDLAYQSEDIIKSAAEQASLESSA